MVTLYFFGPQSLAILGAGRFLQLYLGGGLISSLCQAYWPLIIPNSWPARYRLRPGSALGASGSVSAAITYNILFNPTQIIYLYMIIPVPAALAGLGFIGKDLYELYQGDTNIGNAAHLGGAAFGTVFYFLMKRKGIGRIGTLATKLESLFSRKNNNKKL